MAPSGPDERAKKTQEFAKQRPPLRRGGNPCAGCMSPYREAMQTILRSWIADGYFNQSALWEHMKEVYEIPYRNPDSMIKHLAKHEPLYAELRKKRASVGN